MDPRPLTPAERQALAALLDDPAPTVRQALLQRLGAAGEEAREFLQGFIHGADSAAAADAAWYLRELRFADPVAEFRGFIQSLNYELETGVILLTRTVNPSFDLAAFGAQLDAFAARARRLLPRAGSLRAQCRVLNRVLFEEYGLRGNREEYTDPRNSFPDEVLARRLGLPISLAVIYLLVAQRVGVELEPIGAPGHFLVGGYEPEGPFFIDPFEEGRLLGPEEVFARLRALEQKPQLADLAPTPVREVLCRMCRNLAHHYTIAEEPARARLFASFVAEFEATYERHARP